jgi:hypothetical protein
MRVISLSTIPPRFPMIGAALRSLLGQSCRVDEIRLYVPRRYRRFPGYDGVVPEVPKGITLVRVDEDLGPASKVLFAARELRGTQASILFCDDDKIFAPNWAAELFGAQDERPNECVALVGKPIPATMARNSARQPVARRGNGMELEYRLRRLRQQLRSLMGKPSPREMRRPVRQAGYVDILQGLGGAVVRPDFFDDAAYDIPDVLWAVDDVWLSGILAKNGVPIWLPKGLKMPAPSDAHAIDSLYRSTIEGADRHEANRRCIAYMQERFGVWI